MGNCLRHPSSAKHNDEDWEYSPEPEEKVEESPAKYIGGKTTTEVKIKITKKQLKALLGKADAQDLKMEHLLAQLMAHQRPWKPALQTIPELNSSESL